MSGPLSRNSHFDRFWYISGWPRAESVLGPNLHHVTCRNQQITVFVRQ